MALRYLIPLVLLFVTGVAGLASYYSGSGALIRQVQRTETDNLKRLLHSLEDRLAYNLRNQDTERVREELAALGAYPTLQLALLLDNTGTVLGSLRRADIGKSGDALLQAHFGDTLAPGLDAWLRSPATHAGGTIEYDAQRRQLIGIYPIDIGAQAGALPASRAGLLIVQSDVNLPYRIEQRLLQQHTLGFVTIMSLLALTLWLVTQRVVTQRLNRLLAATRRLGEGDLDARTGVSGSDELGLIAAALDRTAERLAQTQRQLSESEQLLRNAQAIGNIGHWHWELADNRITWSDQVYEIFGLRPQEQAATFEAFLEYVHPDDRQAVRDAVAAALERDIPYSMDHRIIRADGTERIVHEQAETYKDAAGNAVRLLGTIQDVTEIKRHEAALFEAKERALVTLHSIGDAVITTDSNGCVEYLNPVAEELTGWPQSEAAGRPLSDIFRIFNEFTMQPAKNPVETCLRENRIVGLANHTVLVSRDGAVRPIEDSAAPIRDRDGQIIGVVLVFHDVSETQQMARELTWHATHDPLTGLHNRYEFEQRLQTALARRTQGAAGHAVLYMDLDQFKVVNDTCGHAAGDELLKQLATRMRNELREQDTLARLGGDEFGVLLEACGRAQATAIAERLRDTVRELRFVWQGRTFQVSASIGLVMVGDLPADIGMVMSTADMACFAAKDSGRDRIHHYHPDDAELRQRKGEMQIISRLNEALEEDRFQLFGQRIAPVSGNASDHIEVLLRMVDTNGTLLLPGAFIPAAERYHLMPAIDRWVIRNFFAQYGKHLRQRARNRPSADAMDGLFAINVSGASINDETFLTYVVEQIDSHRIPAAALCFEITETAAIGNLNRALRFMEELTQRGCSFALDDFGTGLSSFGYLKNLPVNYLKIDGLLVKDIGSDPIDRVMVDAINRIGHEMGLRTVAEFVEDDAILACLLEIGVDYAQGYGIEPPCPLDELLATVTARA